MSNVRRHVVAATDMPTLLDILDSAVKIGLGALITAGAGLLVSKRSQRHELKKAATEDRRALLRSAASLLEQATAAANLATYVLAHVPDGNSESTKRLVEAINKLNEARSLTVLSGSRVLASEIAQLRGGFEGLCGYLLTVGEDYSIREANRLITSLNQSWPKIYSELEAAYGALHDDA